MTTSHGRPHTLALCATVATATAFAAVGLASPASAAPVNMTCAASGDPLQACDGGVLTRSLPNSPHTDLWTVSFTLSPSDNCAPLMMKTTSVPNAGPMQVLGNDRLEPGQSTPKYEIINTQGKGASVSLHATGIQAGCNTGSLMAWAGDLQVEPIIGPG
jgi:hypothetical protein